MVSPAEAITGRHKVVVIDDDPSIAALVRGAVNSSNFELFSAHTAADGLEQIRTHRPDVVILDNILPDCSGIDVLPEIHHLDANMPILFITARGTGTVAIEAMKQCAFDYLSKPLDLSGLRELIQRAIEVRQLARETTHRTDISFQVGQDGDVLVGKCAAMQNVFKAIGKVALQDVAVLVRGETGTGRETVALAIHQHSEASSGAFVKVHCPAFDEQGLDEELFGNPELGTKGKVYEARSGTLVVQEICHLPLSLQSKLLRSLRLVGESAAGTEDKRKRCRLIATTSEDLETQVRSGRFRADIYYLLSSFSIQLPPLRQRGEDVPILIDYLLMRFAKGTQSLGAQQLRISREAVDLLSQHTWPGNIDELQSVLRWAILEGKGNVVLTSALRQLLAKGPVIERSGSQLRMETSTNWRQFVDLRIEAGTENLYADALAETETKLITRVLQHTQGNQLRTSKILGITRASLRKKIRSLGIRIQKVVDAKPHNSSDGQDRSPPSTSQDTHDNSDKG